MIARNGEALTRRPSFMGRLPAQPLVEPAAFGISPLRRSVAIPANSAPDNAAAPTVIDMQKLADEVSERIGSAAQFLRQAAERLAAEARSDALEVGFMVARRILETDISSNVEHLVGLVRSAIRRLGESRHIKLQLCPEDARLIEEVLKKDGSQNLTSLAAAQIEVIADPSLQRGDCVVAGDLGTVDGRINTRLEELRHALQVGNWEESS
jgi:flagellar biosynthesis/type III secretory pathway protein FliH